MIILRNNPKMRIFELHLKFLIFQSKFVIFQSKFENFDLKMSYKFDSVKNPHTSFSYVNNKISISF